MSAFVRSHTCYLQSLTTVTTNPSYLKYSSAIYDSTGPMEHVDIKEILPVLAELQRLEYSLVDSRNIPTELAGPGIRTYVMSLIVEDTLRVYTIIISGVNRLLDGFYGIDNVEDAEQALNILKDSVEQARKMEDFYHRVGVGAVSMATGGSSWRKPIETRVDFIQKNIQKMTEHLAKLKEAEPASTPKGKLVTRKSTMSTTSAEGEDRAHESSPAANTSQSTTLRTPSLSSAGAAADEALADVPSPRTPPEHAEASPFSTDLKHTESSSVNDLSQETTSPTSPKYDKGIMELMTVAKQNSIVHPVSLI